MSASAACVVIFAASSVTFLLGWAMAYRLGRSVGWCERHFQWIAEERAKRAVNGQFCRKGGA